MMECVGTPGGRKGGATREVAGCVSALLHGQLPAGQLMENQSQRSEGYGINDRYFDEDLTHNWKISSDFHNTVVPPAKPPQQHGDEKTSMPPEQQRERGKGAKSPSSKGGREQEAGEEARVQTASRSGRKRKLASGLRDESFEFGGKFIQNLAVEADTESKNSQVTDYLEVCLDFGNKIQRSFAKHCYEEFVETLKRCSSPKDFMAKMRSVLLDIDLEYIREEWDELVERWLEGFESADSPGSLQKCLSFFLEHAVDMEELMSDNVKKRRRKKVEGEQAGTSLTEEGRSDQVKLEKEKTDKEEEKKKKKKKKKKNEMRKKEEKERDVQSNSARAEGSSSQTLDSENRKEQHLGSGGSVEGAEDESLRSSVKSSKSNKNVVTARKKLDRLVKRVHYAAFKNKEVSFWSDFHRKLRRSCTCQEVAKWLLFVEDNLIAGMMSSKWGGKRSSFVQRCKGCNDGKELQQCLQAFKNNIHWKNVDKSVMIRKRLEGAGDVKKEEEEKRERNEQRGEGEKKVKDKNKTEQESTRGEQEGRESRMSGEMERERSRTEEGNVGHAKPSAGIVEARKHVNRVIRRIHYPAFYNQDRKLWRDFHESVSSCTTVNQVACKFVWAVEQLRPAMLKSSWAGRRRQDWLEECRKCEGKVELKQLRLEMVKEGIDWKEVEDSVWSTSGVKGNETLKDEIMACKPARTPKFGEDDLQLQDWRDWSAACRKAAEKFGLSNEKVLYIWENNQMPAKDSPLIVKSYVQPPPFKLIHQNLWRCPKLKNTVSLEAKLESSYNRRYKGSRMCDLNHAMFVECDPAECSAGAACRNQRLQRQAYPKCKVIFTQKKGFGLAACVNVKKGTLIQEYIGEVIDREEWERRIERYSNETPVYFFSLVNDLFIDASAYGSLARFINHSCSPNCCAQRWQVGSETRVGIFAAMDIAEGEEFSYDYMFESFGPLGHKCYCGSGNCSGYMGNKGN